MAIVAVLIAIGAPGFIAARKQFIVDSDAEELISAIRTAQNNAISFKNGSVPDVKAWGIKIDLANDNFSLLSVSPPATVTTEKTNLKVYPVTQLNSGSDTEIYIYYTSPFGRAYVCNSAKTNWVMSSRPEQSFEPTDASGCNLASKDITVNYKGSIPSEIVTIATSGDVYAQ
jgi:Tfp pilus assembly protein FimT